MVVTARSARDGFVITNVITGADYQGCMSENLMPCITACFNVQALHIFDMGRMVLRDGGRRFQWLLLRASDPESETLAVEGSGVIESLE